MESNGLQTYLKPFWKSHRILSNLVSHHNPYNDKFTDIIEYFFSNKLFGNNNYTSKKYNKQHSKIFSFHSLFYSKDCIETNLE